MNIWEQIAAQRLQLVDVLEGCNEAQWQTQSLCTAWTVREVVAHLVTPFEFGTVRMLCRIVMSGLNFDKAIAHAAKQLAQRPPQALVHTLRTHAQEQWTPPGFGPEAPLTDIVIHIQDICRPLGLAQTLDGETARVILDFLVTGKARGFTKRAWIAGLRLVPDDLDWSWGNGADVRGPAAAMILALGGRVAGLDALAGEGVQLLRARLAQ